MPSESETTTTTISCATQLLAEAVDAEIARRMSESRRIANELRTSIDRLESEAESVARSEVVRDAVRAIHSELGISLPVYRLGEALNALRGCISQFEACHALTVSSERDVEVPSESSREVDGDHESIAPPAIASAPAPPSDAMLAASTEGSGGTETPAFAAIEAAARRAQELVDLMAREDLDQMPPPRLRPWMEAVAAEVRLAKRSSLRPIRFSAVSGPSSVSSPRSLRAGIRATSAV